MNEYFVRGVLWKAGFILVLGFFIIAAMVSGLNNNWRLEQENKELRAKLTENTNLQDRIVVLEEKTKSIWCNKDAESLTVGSTIPTAAKCKCKCGN